jgi:hypothetical protein
MDTSDTSYTTPFAYHGPSMRPHLHSRLNRFLCELNTDDSGFTSNLTARDYYLMPPNENMQQFHLHIPANRFVRFNWNNCPQDFGEAVAWFQWKHSAWLAPVKEFYKIRKTIEQFLHFASLTSDTELPEGNLGLMDRPPLYPYGYSEHICDLETFTQLRRFVEGICVHLSYVEVYCRMGANVVVRSPIYNYHTTANAIGFFYEPPYVLNYSGDKIVNVTCDPHDIPIRYNAETTFNEVRMDVITRLAKRPDLYKHIPNTWYKSAWYFALPLTPRNLPTNTAACFAIINSDDDLPDLINVDSDIEIDELDEMTIDSPEIPLSSLPNIFSHNNSLNSASSAELAASTESMTISDDDKVSDSDSTRANYEFWTNGESHSFFHDDPPHQPHVTPGSDPVDLDNALGLSGIEQANNHPMILRKRKSKPNNRRRSGRLANKKADKSE